jgi:uncharacterized membrane protein
MILPLSFPIFDITIILVAFFGFCIASYIRYKKVSKKTLICPLRTNCDTVINSNHSRFFGIPVEMLGLAYYALVVIYHSALIAVPDLVSPIFVLVSLLLSTIAFIFSVYLTAIQAFVLKKWCTWCLISASFCLGIFIMTIAWSHFPIIDLLAEYSRIFTIGHLFGVALGVGGATIADVFFFKFLKDYKISFEESDILKVLSEVIWFALFILIITGIAIFIPRYETLVHSGKFLAKMTALLILIINGFALNIVVAPRLAKIVFVDENPSANPTILSFRRLAFALGGVSVTSWYFVFLLGAMRGAILSFGLLITIYFSLLFCAMIGGLIFEYLVTHKKLPETN